MSGANGKASASGNGRHAVLRDISLNVPAGSTLAIVGPTGSGKTTLAALVRVFGKRQMELCCSTANLCASGRLRRCAARLVLCRRTPIFSAKRLAAISVSGFRKWMARAFARPRKSRSRWRRARVHGKIRNDGRRTRHHAFRWAETTHRHRSRRRARPAHSDSGRFPVQRGYADRGTDLQRLRGVMDGRTTILISHRTSTVKDADQIVVLVDAASPNVERMMNCFHAADITPICIRSSFGRRTRAGMSICTKKRHSAKRTTRT